MDSIGISYNVSCLKYFEYYINCQKLEFEKFHVSYKDASPKYGFL